MIVEELRTVRRGTGMGVVVPDVMNLYPLGYVMVDFDRTGLKLCVERELDTTGCVKVEFDGRKCITCVFAGSSDCHRYSNGMLGHFPSSNKRVPERIYPYCKNEEKRHADLEKKVCPECGSIDVEVIDDSDWVTGAVGDHMHCKSCNHAWEFNAY